MGPPLTGLERRTVLDIEEGSEPAWVEAAGVAAQQ